MIGMRGVRFKALSLFAMLLTAVAVVSCSEDLAGGNSCPVLCPQDAPPLKDTILDAVTFDTSLSSFPALGFESILLLAKHGDTVDSRVVTRYDTLPTTYSAAGQDSTIQHIDSAFITGRRLAADSLLSFHDSATVEVYDVTDATSDTATAALLAQFTPANRIGVRQYVKGDKPDTFRVWLDTGRVAKRVIVDKRLHIALRMVTTGSEEVRLISQNGGDGLTLTIRASPDTNVKPLAVEPTSDFPTGVSFLAPALADFSFVASARPVGANLLRIGGLPGRRAMLRFFIPSRIVDSSAVIRATLFLTQSPTGPNAGDSVQIHIVPIIASEHVTDLHTLLEFAAVGTTLVDSVGVLPKDSVRRSFELVKVVQAWRDQDTLKTPRVIALTLGGEGQRPTAVNFFSIEAPAGVRPQLRITYVAKLNSGRP